MPAVQECFPTARAATARATIQRGNRGSGEMKQSDMTQSDMTQSFEELTTRQLGVLGERIVAEMLEDQGWDIVVRNERVGRYELDIIAEDTAGTLHFVEVKTRRSSRSSQFGDGREAITAAKLMHLRKAAGQWLSESFTYWSEAVIIDCAEVTVSSPSASSSDSPPVAVVTYIPGIGEANMWDC